MILKGIDLPPPIAGGLSQKRRKLKHREPNTRVLSCWVVCFRAAALFVALADGLLFAKSMLKHWQIAGSSRIIARKARILRE